MTADTPRPTAADGEREAALRQRAERAEETVRAWQGVVEGLTAHLQDRVAMSDQASPASYLRIIQSDTAQVARDSEQMLRSRWHDVAAANARATRAEAERDALQAEVARLREGSPDDLRAQSWAVAVHNDYRLNGEAHTFWLFTQGVRFIKGEGPSDADALNAIRAALSATSAPATTGEGGGK